MSEFKARPAEGDAEEAKEDFASIVREERKRLKLLNKKIERLFWQIEKEEQLNAGADQQKVSNLNTQLRGDLYSYDMIVKRLIDLKEKAPESEEDQDGYKKEIISLIKWAEEEGEKHTLMVRKVNQNHGKKLLRDLPSVRGGSPQRTSSGRQRNGDLVRRIRIRRRPNAKSDS